MKDLFHIEKHWAETNDRMAIFLGTWHPVYKEIIIANLLLKTLDRTYPNIQVYKNRYEGKIMWTFDFLLSKYLYILHVIVCMYVSLLTTSR